ncbi:glycosyltransferase [Nostoc sp. C117]|uniref:glycosyltransferase family 39 protein n=1 Tax=Nostoc sp. C117 TaxID=3349875 RepID=UPI00370DAAF5
MRLHNWYASLPPSWLDPLLCFIWLVVGIGLRLANLTAKPPWTDEFSTLVFSLGNSFLSVPLDRAIAPDILLQPLQPQPSADVQDLWAHLSYETNHPPLYFVLTHWWLKLFPTEQGLVSLWGARSLAALFGAASIPAIYTFSWLTFRSRLVSHLAAAMMVVSPYGIFLAQEARHYTLAILWVIASLSCLVIATRHIQKRTQLPIWLMLSWVVINALGIATHYFFIFTIGTEALVLIFLGWQHSKQKKPHHLLSPPWQRIYTVFIGSLVAAVIWLPVLMGNLYGSKLTEWIQMEYPRVGIAWISPIFQALGTCITMISLLPVESPQLLVVIASGLVMLIFFIWAVPILLGGIEVQIQQPETRIMIQVLAGIAIGAIALFLSFTYFFGIDLTRGARYNFVYFPSIIVLIAASLAACWHPPKELVGTEQGKKSTGRWGINGKKAVILIWLMGFVSAITVFCNLGYQKYYRPDLFVQLIQQISPVPVLIATTQKTHVHIGEMMGIAREFKLGNSPPNPLFLLAHQDQDPNTSSIALENTLKTLARPFDLWLVNFHAPIAEAVKTCVISDTQSLPRVDGYEYLLFHCQES